MPLASLPAAKKSRPSEAGIYAEVSYMPPRMVRHWAFVVSSIQQGEVTLCTQVLFRNLSLVKCQSLPPRTAFPCHSVMCQGQNVLRMLLTDIGVPRMVCPFASATSVTGSDNGRESLHDSVTGAFIATTSRSDVVKPTAIGV